MRIRADLPDISIFVSRRIDVNSMAVDNPLYRPMRCGAVFDTARNSAYAGDNTGNNISDKRLSYCELTVQYWAWKNVEADYYGLCHYRRYFSFSKREYRTNGHGLVERAILDNRECQCFGLLDPVRMSEQIAECDMIIPQAASVDKMPLPRGRAHTVREMWIAHEGIFFPAGTVERVSELIGKIAPEYARAAEDYLSGGYHCGYNCYVMKNMLFDRLCRLQFSVMAAVPLAENYPRTRAYVGEMLFGVFCHRVRTQEQYHVQERQLVLFEHTEPVKNGKEYIALCLKTQMGQMVRSIAGPLFPLGSARRERAKAIYNKIVNKNTW